ncbi:hypothetical protein IMZ48_12045 [Candidatus Bathyarchaeota archaeon]|nr:hypothetical protein [Candidatus Bathyarchaeota archaeon]
MTLRYKEKEPIDVTEWCSASVLAHDESRASLAAESERAAKQEREVEDLQTQLNELIEAKKADEAGLMEKFRDLLNEKKVKIREQQRLLANAPTAHSPQEEQAVASTSGGSPGVKIKEEARGHTPMPSRRSKRKTVTPIEEESDGGFEKMDVDVDEQPAPARDSEDDRTTDAGSDGDVTASEDDEEPPAKAAAGPSTRGKGKGKDEAPPPKRDLPFARKRGGSAKPAPKAAGSVTSSDDEL